MTTHPRLDSDIFAAARKVLDDDPSVPQDVRVHVDRGTVTLTGTVRWPREKSESEAVCPSDRWCPGSRQSHHGGASGQRGRPRGTRLPLGV
jgi:hypothetical protein